MDFLIVLLLAILGITPVFLFKLKKDIKYKLLIVLIIVYLFLGWYLIPIFHCFNLLKFYPFVFMMVILWVITCLASFVSKK